MRAHTRRPPRLQRRRRLPSRRSSVTCSRQLAWRASSRGGWAGAGWTVGARRPGRRQTTARTARRTRVGRPRRNSSATADKVPISHSSPRCPTPSLLLPPALPPPLRLSAVCSGAAGSVAVQELCGGGEAHAEGVRGQGEGGLTVSQRTRPNGRAGARLKQAGHWKGVGRVGVGRGGAGAAAAASSTESCFCVHQGCECSAGAPRPCPRPPSAAPPHPPSGTSGAPS